jgi:hypothetical protein
MRHWLAIACLLPLLVGCNTVRPEPLPPYALSDADTAIVLRGLYSAVKDLDEPGLRNLKAVRNNGGEVYLCGWLSWRNGRGGRAEQAFIGTLSAGRFSPSRVAKDDYSTGEVLTECQERGLAIS